MAISKYRSAWFLILMTSALAVALLIGFSYRAEQQPAIPPAAQVNTPAPPTADRAQAARAVNTRTHARPLAELPKPGPLPASLAGAEPEIQLRTDENGNLLPEEGLIRLFDFYLSALGEEPLETVLARIHLAMDGQLDGNALAQARDLLRRYVDYKIALAELEARSPAGAPDGGLSVPALRQRFQDLTALRQTLFSPEESTAFFQLDNAQDEYMLQRLALAEDASLTESQRQQAMASLEQQLPAEIRDLRKRVTRDANLYASTEAMRQAGASAEQIYQVRAEALGEEAAANLAQLDRKRTQWKQRLADYARERDKIRQSGLSQADQQAAISSLIDSRFTEPERLRVRALDADL